MGLSCLNHDLSEPSAAFVVMLSCLRVLALGESCHGKVGFSAFAFLQKLLF
jgi:hypothetical protein